MDCRQLADSDQEQELGSVHQVLLGKILGVSHHWLSEVDQILLLHLALLKGSVEGPQAPQHSPGTRALTEN